MVSMLKQSRVGAALMSEQEEARLHALIAETACDLISAEIAALTLRRVSEESEPLVPPEGHLFHLATIVGVTPEQEAQLRRMPLGGAGLLAPIFRYGVPVLVADTHALQRATERDASTDRSPSNVATPCDLSVRVQPATVMPL
ncbi:hypothetical protein [Dictyobacter aurantiacus]|uniref:Uncharacterized protein n=1 Tax=Dictyobacter aurantiacus TaxID=1936993 RepID=A0A401ZM83_9CHLR|nr:hypothetical protein [Dictyobacter aurantiacus]GCE07942.1 hypothetical protein KDAU_52710 [Dictyobacter aurantiacus]